MTESVPPPPRRGAPYSVRPRPDAHLGEAGAAQRYRDERDALRNRLTTARREIDDLRAEVARLRKLTTPVKTGPVTDMTPRQAITACQRAAMTAPVDSELPEAVEVLAEYIEQLEDAVDHYAGDGAAS